MGSQRVSIAILVICAASVLGKPLSIDVFENKDVLSAKKSDVVKRTTELETNDDVAELSIPKISLSAFIDNLESSLFQTALSAGSVAINPSAQVEQITPSPVPALIKRSVVEVEQEQEPIVLVQTTEKVSAVEAVPAHVVIDRVSVFKSPVLGAALLPTFHFQEAPVRISLKPAVDVDVEEDTFLVQTTTLPDGEESAESESAESSEESKEVSSTVSSSVPPSSTTPVDEKKAAEKELKEKVAEVEADPVILTARV